MQEDKWHFVRNWFFIFFIFYFLFIYLFFFTNIESAGYTKVQVSSQRIHTFKEENKMSTNN